MKNRNKVQKRPNMRIEHHPAVNGKWHLRVNSVASSKLKAVLHPWAVGQRGRMLASMLLSQLKKKIAKKKQGKSETKAARTEC